jgi:hypothetical protein
MKRNEKQSTESAACLEYPERWLKQCFASALVAEADEATNCVIVGSADT